MSVWQWTLVCLLVIVLLIAAAIAFPVWRRRRISSDAGTFELALSRSGDRGTHRWVLGVARYGEDEIEWFATFGVSLQPRHRFVRERLEVDGRSRRPHGREVPALYPGSVIVSCRTDVGFRQLALTPGALTGLLAWLEASPPGHGVNNVL